MSEFEETGISIDAQGAFTALDWQMMDEWELNERLRIVRERIAEYEDEEEGIEAEIERRPASPATARESEGEAG